MPDDDKQLGYDAFFELLPAIYENPKIYKAVYFDGRVEGFEFSQERIQSIVGDLAMVPIYAGNPQGFSEGWQIAVCQTVEKLSDHYEASGQPAEEAWAWVMSNSPIKNEREAIEGLVGIACFFEMMAKLLEVKLTAAGADTPSPDHAALMQEAHVHLGDIANYFEISRPAC